MQENTNLDEFKQKLEGYNEDYLGPIFKESRDEEIRIFLQPLKSIHLHSHLEYELGVNSDIRVIYAFAAIAIVILLIACINFMNLATARSTIRAKEVGMRKVLGAKRGQLIFQFLGESFVFATLSLVIAIALTRLVLPYFRILASREISANYLQMPYLYAGLAGIVLFVGFISGSYPAFFLSAFKPISALTGNMQKGSKNSLVRSILVILQFAISVILIINTIIIFNQHKYLKNKALGFNKQNLLVIALQNKDVRLGLESFENEILKIKGVVSAGASSMVPGEIYLFISDTYPEGFPRDQRFRMENFYVDHDFLHTLNIEIVKGRGFSREITTDVTDAVMINETATRKLEWNDPVGKTIDIATPLSTNKVRKTVIGVFRDIHQRSLYAVVQPTFIQHISNEGEIRNRARRLAYGWKRTIFPGR